MSAAAWMVLAALAEVGVPPPAPVSYELHWVRAPGSEGCIDARELAERVATRLGRPVFDGAGTDTVVIDGVVGPAADGWRVTVAVRGPDGAVRGARELEQAGSDCRALDGPLALVVALIIELDIASAAAPEPAPPPVPRARWQLDGVVAGQAAVGALPEPGLGARVALAVDAPWMWPVVVGVSWWVPGEDGDAMRGVRLRPWKLDAVVCTPPGHLGPVRVAGCGGAGAERIGAVGMGFDRNHEVSAIVGLAALRGQATVDLAGPTFLAGELGLDIRWTRPRFVFEDGGTWLVHQPTRGQLVGTLGLGVHF